jgi:hypothetical protein
MPSKIVLLDKSLRQVEHESFIRQVEQKKFYKTRLG